MAKKRKTLPKEIDELLKRGDVEELKKLFVRCEPNALRYGKSGRNVFALTPLPREFAFWAKEQGADVNFLDPDGHTPIFTHASYYNGDMQLMIDLGADIHATLCDGSTPLHYAAVYGRTEAMKALLHAGAQVDVRRKSHWDCYTPLEEALEQNRLPVEQLLEVCTLLLDHGAQITDTARELVTRIGERFQRNKRDIADLVYLAQQLDALNQLYRLFDVEPVAEVEIPFHDGVSPIVITETEPDAQFQKLWEYLIPPQGKAQTAQGEAVRIAGRVRDELLRNGGANWDKNYRMMLRAFPDYLRLGNPLPEGRIAEAERLVSLLRTGRCDEKAADALCACAVEWVLQNPDVLLPLPAEYQR